MRLTIIITFLMFSANVIACSEAMRPYSEECLQQDRIQIVKKELKKISINVEDLQGYKLARVTMSSNLAKNQIQQSAEWVQWKNGQQYIATLKAIHLNMIDILKLHKSIFGTNDSGKFRSNDGIAKPQEAITCQSYLLNSEALASLTASEMLSEESYQLLELENVQACPKKDFYSATLVYYKGASVKAELGRWLVDFNDMINRYESVGLQEISPLQYIADMRRLFMAISPFAQGNAEVINALSDYFMKRLNLLPLPLIDINKPHLLSKEKNRILLKQRSHDVLTYVESCLLENKTKSISISTNCSSL
jgi:hypothetical protein